MFIAQTLARFARDTRTIGPQSRRAAVRALLDLLGTALAGADTAASAAALTAARACWGEGPASIWFGRDRLAVPGAAFVNATYGSILDLDDGHRGAAGHPGAAIVPAVIATAQAIGASVDGMLTAMVTGYEIGLRVAAARDVKALRTTDTGQWCGVGVAAAAGSLRGLPADTIAHAMAIAGHTASGQFATGWTRLGHTVKEGIPWATANGLIAVELAASGQTGPIDFLDDPGRYDRTRLQLALGEAWEIEQAYLKLYSCCRWAHAAIDAALDIQAAHGVEAAAIDSIEIATFGRACSLNNEPSPQTMEGAQYSVPFCVALALVCGPDALLPVQSHALGNRRVVELARRIRLTADPRLDAMFPAAAPARVEVSAGGRRYAAEIHAPKGEPANPLSQAELEAKFDALARQSGRDLQARDLKSIVLSLDEATGLDELFTAIGMDPQSYRNRSAAPVTA